MSFIPYDTNDTNIKLGIWEVEEGEMFFLTQLKMYEHEWCRLEKIMHPQKRLEWLSSRLIIKKLLRIEHDQRVESLNADNGKPYLSNNSHNISYSHSDKYSAAIASPAHEVGIDIEYLHRRRNLKTRFLFMNDDELKMFDHFQEDFRYFILIWSAKETLYKIISQRGISFKNHLSVQLNTDDLESRGEVTGRVLKEGLCRHYKIYYYLNDNFILTYTFDPITQPVYSDSLLIKN